MRRDFVPTEFFGKRWIYVVQTVIFGGFTVFSLVMGPLFLFGVVKDVRGRPATGAGAALTAIGIAFGAVTGLGLYNVLARRRPLLRFSREGVEIRLVGSSSLDAIPGVPVMIRAAWAIVSGQGFRDSLFFAPWHEVRSAYVTGVPTARYLMIDATLFASAARSDENVEPALASLSLPEHELASPPRMMADAINHFARDATARAGLPSR